jgi:predicted PurR-regulated permease PerM
LYERRRRDVLIPLLVALGFIFVLAILVFRPFLLTFTVSASVALLLQPVYSRLQRGLGGRSSIAAALIVLVTTAAILIPVVSSVVILGSEALAFFDWLGPRLEPRELEKLLNETIRTRFPNHRWFDRSEAELTPVVSAALSSLTAGASALVQRIAAGVTTAVYELCLFLFMQFFLLRDGDKLRNELRQVSPFSEAQEAQILDHLGRTVKGALQVMIVVPLAQGFAAALGFWFFGVPSPVVWGVAVTFTALVPIFGSALGWVPACAYLFLYASTWQWVGMLIFGLVVISGIDNVLKPMLLHGSADIHPLLGFLAILGGVLAFGVSGLLIGPVILSLVLSALKIYRLDVLRSHPPAPPAPAASPG